MFLCFSRRQDAFESPARACWSALSMGCEGPGFSSCVGGQQSWKNMNLVNIQSAPWTHCRDKNVDVESSGCATTSTEDCG